MAEPVQRLPDALVLGAGGTLGIAWLHGLVLGRGGAPGRALRRCESFVGTSAGAFVAAIRAAGHRVGEPAADPGPLRDAAAGLAPDGDAADGPLRRLAGQAGRAAAG